MKKPKSLKNLANTCWTLFSELVRRQEANEHGYCKCVSCGVLGKWEDFDAGHFVHAGTGGKQNPVSYDARNVHAQCRQDNRQPGSKHKHQTMVAHRYTAWMIEKYGPTIIDQLEFIKRQPWLRHQDLQDKIEVYKARLESLRRS